MMKTYTPQEINDYNLVNRKNEILNWCKEHRPDVVGSMEQILDGKGPQAEAQLFLIAIVFSAGRKFQHLNPDVSIHKGI